jgi:2-oxo-4-hydroxy-4-carboxy--5-ureidoimidazoline (OHCU) decarboxylase
VPALSSLTEPAVVDRTLSLLLEPSPVLHSKLTPAITTRIATSGSPTTYSQLVDLCAAEIEGWSLEDKAAFLGGHPLIGEVKNLSAMSAKEQGGKSAKTPEIVLKRCVEAESTRASSWWPADRLAHLNKLYTHVYPGLPYITFVAGRPRSAIAKEIERVLEIAASPEPIPDDWKDVEEPELESAEVRSKVKVWGGVEWQREMQRALGDIWLIAKSRLQGMGLEWGLAVSGQPVLESVSSRP